MSGHVTVRTRLHRIDSIVCFCFDFVFFRFSFDFRHAAPTERWRNDDGGCPPMGTGGHSLHGMLVFVNVVDHCTHDACMTHNSLIHNN